MPPAPPPLRPLRRWWLVGCGAVPVALVLLGLGWGQADPDVARSLWIPITVAVSFTPLALFILRQVPRHPIGRLMLTAGMTSTLDVIAICWSLWTPAAWLAQWLWWPPFGLIPLALLRFPDGSYPSRRWRPVAILLIIASSSAGLALALGALAAPRSLVSTVGEVLPPLARAMAQVAIGGIGVTVLATIPVAFALGWRWRLAGPLERRQIACLVPSSAFLAVGIVLSVVSVPGAWIPAVVALPVGFTFAILQYQLLDLDLVIHRGLVWILLTLIAVSLYAVSVAALDAALSPSRSWTASLLAGAATAAFLMPAERFAQRASSRLLFGRRDDPYAVLVQVGRHIEAIRDPLEVLPRLAATLVEALRVPYVAIELNMADTTDPLVVGHGRQTVEPTHRFAMMAHGVEVGGLLVASRRANAQFSASESRLIQGLATQAATAAEACRSSLDLQRARERLVLAREEERRRLRRDLHDGVGSALVGARMLAVAAMGGAQTGDRTRRLLETLNDDLALCTSEVRSLIDGLRPAALDDGLETALRLSVNALSASLDVRLDVTGDLAELPAAVEVVSLRVVTEALTNVVKHSAATTCVVSLTRSDSMLRMSIVDNGTGLRDAVGSADQRHGVGLASMRSRIEEVGGWLAVRSSTNGLAVEVGLPTRHEAISALSEAST